MTIFGVRFHPISYQNVILQLTVYINGKAEIEQWYMWTPEYGRLEKHEDLRNVAAVVTLLHDNTGEASYAGDVGKQGDIAGRTGFIDINNTAMLIELASRIKYQPDFHSTHTFQDLVEETLNIYPYI